MTDMAHSGLKVLFFDSWTEGTINILPLLAAFPQLNLNPMLVHLGSWGHDPGRPEEEFIKGLLTRDVRYYRNKSFGEILSTEKPDVVAFLSTRAFAHRAFIRYCVQQGIPTVHVFHGLYGIQDFSSGRFGYLGETRILKQIARVLSRLLPNLIKIVPNYLRALIDTRARPGEWITFARNIVDQARGRLGWAGALDSATSACCVYTEAEIDVISNWYGVPRDAVHAVGNPDLVKFALTEQDLGACISSGSSNVVIYIETALLQVTNIYLSAKELLDHFVTTKNALERQGYRLKVKLHPAHFSTQFPQQLTAAGIELCSNEEVVREIKNGATTISEPSSVVLLPCLLGARVFLAQYGRLQGLKYGASLLNYPYAQTLTSIEDFKEAMRNFDKPVPASAVWAWIRTNSGPIPAEQMPLRVGRVIRELALQHRAELAGQASPAHSPS